MALAIFAPPWIDGSIGLAKSRSSWQRTWRSIHSTLRANASHVIASMEAVSAVPARRVGCPSARSSDWNPLLPIGVAFAVDACQVNHAKARTLPIR